MPSTEPTLTTQSSGSLGSAEKPFERPSATQSDSAGLGARVKSSEDCASKNIAKSSAVSGKTGGPRRFPGAVQTTHFKAFWVKPVEGKTSAPDLVQTVIPKRLLKKAVDRNGLRRVLREAVRVKLKGPAPTPRVVLVSAKGFSEEASRHALKGAWREELDRLLALLLLRLKV
jgi:ribonuclease P protein component